MTNYQSLPVEIFTGFKNNMYYERNKLLTYANRTQANKKCEWLKAQGINCFVRNRHPFIILEVIK